MLVAASELSEILASWELEPDVTFLRSSYHEIYRVRRQKKNGYLRITPNIRSLDEVRSELEWIDDLRAHDMPVVTALPNRLGSKMEHRELLAGPMTAVLFEEAPGRLASKQRDFNIPVIESWAKLMKDLHQHAKNFRPTGARRSSWESDSVTKIAIQQAKISTEAEAKFFLNCIARHAGPQNNTADLILTHCDLHLGNLSITEDQQVWAFDFDDSCYHFRSHDVAVALVSIRKAAWELPELGINAQELERCFLEHYGLPCFELEQWCAFRIALAYFWAKGAAEAGAFDQERKAWLEKSTPWWKKQIAPHL